MKVKCEDYDSIKALVGCLKKDRAEDRAQWLDVGFCLYNINDDLLELWDGFHNRVINIKVVNVINSMYNS